MQFYTKAFTTPLKTVTTESIRGFLLLAVFCDFILGYENSMLQDDAIWIFRDLNRVKENCACKEVCAQRIFWKIGDYLHIGMLYWYAVWHTLLKFHLTQTLY